MSLILNDKWEYKSYHQKYDKRQNNKSFVEVSFKPRHFQFTNEENNIYRNKKYWINENNSNIDYWFILEDLNQRSETVNLKNNNLFFLSSETYSPDYYTKESKKNFLAQFKNIYTPITYLWKMLLEPTIFAMVFEERSLY